VATDATDLPRAGTFWVNCPRCGLSILQRFRCYSLRHCPRCIARGHILVELFTSVLPTEALYAERYLPRIADTDDQSRAQAHADEP
jgi:hypothetical protein